MSHKPSKGIHKAARLPVPDMRPEREEIMAKIRARVIVTETGCWEWQKFRNKLGYGHTNWRGRSWTVTRLVHAAHYGAFDPRKDVCHECDNPPCCNPHHLWLGDQKTNQADSVEKGRHKYSNLTHCPRGHSYADHGVKHGKRQWRQCKICIRGRCRVRMGWPPELAYSIDVIPPGYGFDAQTGALIAVGAKTWATRRARMASEP